MSREDEDTPKQTEASTSGSGSPYKDERDDTIDRQKKLGRDDEKPLRPLSESGEEQEPEATGADDKPGR